MLLYLKWGGGVAVSVLTWWWSKATSKQLQHIFHTDTPPAPPSADLPHDVKFTQLQVGLCLALNIHATQQHIFHTDTPLLHPVLTFHSCMGPCLALSSACCATCRNPDHYGSRNVLCSFDFDSC